MVKFQKTELSTQPGLFCDDTWHRRGFSSLYGATFVISEQTGQVLDYDFMSKTSSTCRLWAYEDQQSSKYKEFWQSHKDHTLE